MSGKNRITDSERRALAEARAAREPARPHAAQCAAGAEDRQRPSHGDESFNPFRFQIKTLPRGLRAQMLRVELPLIPPEELMERVPLAERARSRLHRGWTWLDQLLWARRIPAGIGLIALAVLALALAIILRPRRASSQGDPNRERAPAAAPLPSPDGVLSARMAATSVPAEPPTTGEVEPAASTAQSAAPGAPVERKLAAVERPVAPPTSTAPSPSAAGVGSAHAPGMRIKKFFIPD
jgi:hypothetical protein